MKEKPIQTIGHRNPDTDSICSAIGYAHLKRALGENVLPARAGKMNAETKYVLEKFSIDTPKLITDLFTSKLLIYTACSTLLSANSNLL